MPPPPLGKASEFHLATEVGIYKRKQELDQESDQESKKTRTRPRKRSRKQENKKENKNLTKKATKKKKLSFFLDHFLGRILTFLFSFKNFHLSTRSFALPEPCGQEMCTVEGLILTTIHSLLPARWRWEAKH